MIERIELRDFKAHAHTVVDLGRLTVLVGPNSGGKTSVLEALHVAVRGFSGELQRHTDAPPVVPDVPHAVRIGCDVARLTLALDGVTLAGRLSPPAMPGTGAKPDYFMWNEDSDPDHQLPDIFTPSDYLAPGRSLLARPEVAGMRRRSRFNDNNSSDNRLSASASNLAAQIALLKLTNDEAFTALRNDIRTIVPAVKQLYAIPRGGDFEIAMDFRGATKVPATAISEGTLITLALLTYLYEPDPPTLLLIDDIDRGLHPGAQRELIAILRRLLDRRPELQIVATTHSPYIVEAVDPEDVRVCALRKDGTVAVKPLLAHPEAHRALEILNAAEFWDAEGEAWVTEIEDTPAEDTEA
ncbi:MAG: AAA family ATPase [bacterium]